MNQHRRIRGGRWHVFNVKNLIDLAEKERRIAAGTRSVLQAREARGARLGNRTNPRETLALGRRALAAEADAFAANVMSIVESLRASGVRDLRGLASALNVRRAKSPDLTAS
jgi:hypothetical protein